MQPEEIRAIEKHLFRAWPALSTRFYDGWVLRFAGGYTRRANSVNPLYPAEAADVAERIAQCEAIFMDEDIPVCFRLTQISPDGLEATLEADGYTLSDPTYVYTYDLKQFSAESAAKTAQEGLTITLNNKISDAWFQANTHLNHVAKKHHDTLHTMLEKIDMPKAFTAVMKDDQIMATGVGVCGEGYLALFQLAVEPAHQNNGIGTAMIHEMLAWGETNSAQTAYLQVVSDNIGAQRLYQRLGFDEGYRYWYREK